jgi:hypothetical protein
MLPPDKGPPDGEGGASPDPAAEKVASPPPQPNNASVNGDALAAGLRRRRKTSYRLPPLECGCVDPWLCRCADPPHSEKTVDGGADAARYLLERGLTPLLHPDTLCALYARGGADRALAQRLYDLAGGGA